MPKSIYTFFVVRFFSSLGDQILLFAVPLLVYKVTQSIAMSGLAFVIEWTPRVISLPFAGVFSDIFGSRRVYLTADAVRAILCLVGFILIHHFYSHAFIIVSILMGICAFFYAQAFIAQEATIPTLVSQSELHKAQSAVQTIEQGTMILGPFFGSLLTLILPIQDLLIVISAIFATGFAGMCYLKQFSTNPAHQLHQHHVMKNMLQGAKVLLEHEKLIWLCIVTIVLNLVWGMALSTGAAFVTGIFQKSEASFGFLQGFSGFLSIVLLVLSPKFIQKTSINILGFLSYLFMITGGLLVAFSKSYWLFGVGYALIMAMDGVFNIYIRTERAKIIPTKDLGKTIGLIVLVNQLSLPISGLLVTHFANIVGVPHLFLMVSVLAFLCLMIGIKKLK